MNLVIPDHLISIFSSKKRRVDKEKKLLRQPRTIKPIKDEDIKKKVLYHQEASSSDSIVSRGNHIKLEERKTL